MDWITDNPIPLFILGLIAQLILGVILWQTGRGGVMFLMIALGVTSIALLVVEVVITSPTEELATTLDNLADALETNKLENVLIFIAPEATAVRTDATQQLKRVQIHEAFVAGDLQVNFDTPPNAETPIATATFIGRIKAKFLKDSSPYEQLAQRFKIYFRKENGKWLVTKYDMNRR